MDFWLCILCFVAGTVCGYAICAMCKAAKSADEAIETLMESQDPPPQVKEGVTGNGVKYRYNPGSRRVDRT